MTVEEMRAGPDARSEVAVGRDALLAEQDIDLGTNRPGQRREAGLGQGIGGGGVRGRLPSDLTPSRRTTW